MNKNFNQSKVKFRCGKKLTDKNGARKRIKVSNNKKVKNPYKHQTDTLQSLNPQYRNIYKTV